MTDMTDDEWDAHFRALNAVGMQHRLVSAWSIVSVGAGKLSEPHPYPSAAALVYETTTFWRTREAEAPDTIETTRVPIEGATWLDLWRAADQAIRLSGDRHHRFIEDFLPCDFGVLRLQTGS